MNRKYMDFVPRNSVSATQVIMPEGEVFEKRVSSVSAVSTRPVGDVKRAKAQKISARPSSVMGRGMVDLAMKKPVSKSARGKASLRRVASAPADGKSREKMIKQAVVKADNLNHAMRVPQARFVNTEKVMKRPLSKNVYQKKIVEPKEEPQGPVTIIQKPEKDSKVGLIVTIIITIILGAAAGTVAFLLLPK